MDSLIEKLGGPDKINECILREISLIQLAKQCGISRFGEKKNQKVLKYYETYYNSGSMISRMRAKYPKIEFNPNDNEKIELHKSEINCVLLLLKEIDLAGYYEEKIIQEVISKIKRDPPEKIDDILDVRENPMILHDYLSISLKKLDKIALDNKWWSQDSMYRYDCYSLDFIQRMCDQKGHTYFKKMDLREFFMNELRNDNITDNINIENINKSIERLIYDGYIFEKKGTYFYKNYFEMEIKILNITDKLVNITYDINHDTHKKTFNTIIVPSKEQIDAINGVKQNFLSNIAGPGGTGKTSICVKELSDEVCNGIPKGIIKVIFTAPTHAAKKNGRKLIGNGDNTEYTVLQSLLYEYYNDKDEIRTNNLYKLLVENDIEYIFIDEASMIDMIMYYKLLNTVNTYNETGVCKSQLHIVFIGDVNQLEPIGIGNPYVSLLKKIPTFQLTENFRANKDIKDFCMVILNNGPKGDKWGIDTELKDKYKDSISFDFTTHEKEWIIKLKNKLIEMKERGLTPCGGDDDNSKSFQIICPYNDICRKISPIVRGIFYDNDSKEVYEPGDIIIMTKNIKGLFYNNDLGRIVDIDSDGYEIELFETYGEMSNGKEDDVIYEGHRINILSTNKIRIPITYKYDIYQNIFIKPSYCRTVHSVQGLQWLEAIYVAPKQGGSFINIKMNYTAFSRAKERLYLIGNQIAFDGHYAKKPGPEKNSILSLKDRTIDGISEILGGKTYTRISQNCIVERCLNISKDKKYKIWNEMNNNSTDGECSECTKNLTIRQFYIFSTDNETYKCLCHKCFRNQSICLDN